VSRQGPVGVGVIGCGNISNEYLTTMAGFPDLRVVGVADLDRSRAEAQAAWYGIGFAGGTAELLARDDVELIVNLTIPAVHAEVGRQAIAAGKHVWTEKPIATDRASGRALLDAADAAGLIVGCAPDTVLGPGIQTARRLVERGDIGKPLVALALMQNPGPDLWHPDPAFLYAAGAGPLFDLGPYYLTALVLLLGSVTRVTALGTRSRDTRVVLKGPRAGAEFPVEVPTHVAVLAEFETGATATIVLTFESPLRRTLIEITGSDATLEVTDPNEFGGDLRIVRASRKRGRVVHADATGFGRGLGVLDTARAIRAGIQPRASGVLGYHVLDVMVAISEAVASGQPRLVDSRVERPPVAPDDWAAAAATLSGSGPRARSP
jgi:predicted dehydrogenase